MGYHFPSKVFPLDFKGGVLAGLEVDCKTGSVEQYESIAALADLPPGAADRVWRQLCEAFAASLVRWNLEDDGGAPVPATLAGLLSQDIELIMAIVETWLDVVLRRKTEAQQSEADREQADVLAEFGHEALS